VANFWARPSELGYGPPMARRLLYLVRHGETDWNAEGRWQGHTDIALNERGRVQARAVAEAMRHVPLAGIVSSDLCRARETAQIIGDRLGLAIAFVDPTLRERAFGPFEGLTREECVLLHSEAWRAWREDQVAPEGAENPAVLAARVAVGLRRVAEEVARDDAGALVVTHGGALRTAVAVVLGAQPPPIANGAIWRTEWDDRIVSAGILLEGA
jgi:broad specificity phosphatase PhoE